MIANECSQKYLPEKMTKKIKQLDILKFGINCEGPILAFDPCCLRVYVSVNRNRIKFDSYPTPA